MHGAAAGQVFNNVTAPISELTGMHLVERIVGGGFGGAQKPVNGRQTAVGGHAVEPELRGSDLRWLGLTDIEEQPG